VRSSAGGGLPPASAGLTCSGQQHTIRWEAGELLALDHGEPMAERALAVLGGLDCPCLDVLSAWARHRDDPRLLSAVTRGMGDNVHPVDEGPGGAGPGWIAMSPGRQRGMARAGPPAGAGRNAVLPARGPKPGGAGGGEAATSDIERLAGLGRALSMRLAASVTSTLLEQPGSGGPEAPSARAALEASLFGRALWVLRAWVGDPSLDIALDVVEPAQAEIRPSGDAHHLQVALPLMWVADVWGRELATVGGRFSLGVVDSSDNGITLWTIGPDYGTPGPLSIQGV
jgi:hypothetical protein